MKLTSIPSETHEEIYRVADPSVGLVGFIALHSTQLGPAAGGLRMRPYTHEAEALRDVERLSEGMTYKNAAAGLPLGGGKAVIIGDPLTQKTPELLASFGQAINALAGRYWTAEDMGLTPADMARLAVETQYVAGLADGEFASGDPSPITARGIFNAIRTAHRHKNGTDSLSGVVVSVQGLGNVGFHLCQLLSNAGAHLIVTDVNKTRVEQAVRDFGATAVELDQIYGVVADVFAPCAIGGILNPETIPQLKVGIVAGGANNQLVGVEDGTALHERGILYAPDFVANGGGIINVATEILKIRKSQEWVAEKLDALDATMDAILTQARVENTSPNAVAIITVAAKMARAAA
ncbi:Leu/Phe/Val dehydrogenase [Pseudohalocynthiibacter aestuariivivens]|uniref:Leu/Phe/Val dehydrogenase n=1 Tax=Pseudohalocynthiibacter aestuariivivens TaxID=1591409 RepID=A0ABV5JD43_9RHOB|nr:Glu/Leu/Phe/Val dehydrogenase dimerization domain-containing protein [Pseudohalocynthiibacter aestuariivivens]MBS9717129.1 Glu/Leu/Phe/Val dehydrogenase [Pseudohalocynthiibacter aestuariivivens]